MLVARGECKQAGRTAWFFELLAILRTRSVRCKSCSDATAGEKMTCRADPSLSCECNTRDTPRGVECGIGYRHLVDT